MAFSAITDAQRQALVKSLTNSTKLVVIEVSGGQRTDTTVIDTALTAAAGALSDAGYSGLASTQAVVTQGNAIQIKNYDGTVSQNGTGLVSNSVAAAQLPATAGIVTDAQTLAVTGGTVTLHVANGIVTATYAAS